MENKMLSIYIPFWDPFSLLH